MTGATFVRVPPAAPMPARLNRLSAVGTNVVGTDFHVAQSA